MSAYVSVRLNRDQINDLLRSQRGPVARDLLRRGNLVQNQAKRVVRVDRGILRASISTELRIEQGGPTVRVGSNVEYAKHVERRYPYLRPSLAAAAG